MIVAQHTGAADRSGQVSRESASFALGAQSFESCHEWAESTMSKAMLCVSANVLE